MPKFTASTAGGAILALGALTFAAVVVKDQLGKNDPPAPSKANPSPKSPAFPAGGVATSGPSLADIVKAAQQPPGQKATTAADLPEVPAILKQIRLSPKVYGNRIDGWAVESMGMAGILDRDKAMRRGDLLMTIDGRDVCEIQGFLDAVRGVRQGQVLSMGVQRGGSKPSPSAGRPVAAATVDPVRTSSGSVSGRIDSVRSSATARSIAF